MARSGAIFFPLLSNPREPGPLPSQHAPRFSNEFRFEFAVWAPFSSVEAAELRWEPGLPALPRSGASLRPDVVSPRRYQPRGGARRAERAAVRRRAGGVGGFYPLASGAAEEPSGRFPGHGALRGREGERRALPCALFFTFSLRYEGRKGGSSPFSPGPEAGRGLPRRGPFPRGPGCPAAARSRSDGAQRPVCPTWLVSVDAFEEGE